MSFETSALLLAWLAILLLGLAMSGILRQLNALTTGSAQGRLQIGPVAGSAAPLIDGILEEWVRPSILLFIDANCSSCAQVLPEFERLAAAGEGRDFIALFRAGSNGFANRFVRVLQNQSSAFAHFRVPATPFGVAVGSTGKILGAAPVGSELLLERFVGLVGRSEVKEDAAR